MTARGGPKPARIFYGWWVALSFVVMGFLTTALELSSRMATYWKFVLYYGVLASLGLGATRHVASATLARWLVRRRATALGLVGAGGR
jgi:hypothetical protein